MSNLEKMLEEHGIRDKRAQIFNLDENHLTTATTKSSYFFKRGSKEVHMTAPTESKTMYTVLFTCNAAGDFHPVHVI